MRITARVKLYYKTDQHNGSYSLSFSPNYEDGANAEWAHATPSLSLAMTVREDVAANFEEGQEYTLIFDPDEKAKAFDTDAEPETESAEDAHDVDENKSAE